MKWLFIILLLLNVVYFGWELDRQTIIITKNSSAPFVIPKNAKRLTLLSEIESPEELKINQEQPEIQSIGNKAIGDESSVNDTGALTNDVMIEEEFSQDLVSNLPDISALGISRENDAEKPLCFSYGPFPGTEQIQTLKEWFEVKNIPVIQRIENEQSKQLFWIYLAPGESRESAMAAIEDLKSKGIKDFRLISSGDLRNAISLGLFSTQAVVNKRLNELKRKGYQPIVVPYHNAREIHWLDVKLVNQQELLNEMFTEFPSRFNSVPMNCSEIALL